MYIIIIYLNSLRIVWLCDVMHFKTTGIYLLFFFLLNILISSLLALFKFY